MIDEFLRCVVDGASPDGVAGIELPAEIAALLAELPAAVDYGLYAMQTWGVSLSAWLAMSRAYQAAIATLAPAAEAVCSGDRLLARCAPAGACSRNCRSRSTTTATFTGARMSTPTSSRGARCASRSARRASPTRSRPAR